MAGLWATAGEAGRGLGMGLAALGLSLTLSLSLFLSLSLSHSLSLSLSGSLRTHFCLQLLAAGQAAAPATLHQLLPTAQQLVVQDCKATPRPTPPAPSLKRLSIGVPRQASGLHCVRQRWQLDPSPLPWPNTLGPLGNCVPTVDRRSQMSPLAACCSHNSEPATLHNTSLTNPVERGRRTCDAARRAQGDVSQNDAQNAADDRDANSVAGQLPQP